MPPGRSSGRCCRRRTRWRSNSIDERLRAARSPRRAASLYHAYVTGSAAVRRLRLRHPARHPAVARHRALAHARPQPAALDHRLADHADPGDRADDHRRARQHRAHRPDAQGGDLDVSVLLPGHHRHGEGPALARSVAARPDAHLLGEPRARSSGSCAGRRRCLPLRLAQGRDRHRPGRRHRRRAADRRAGRPGRAAADRLLLRPDGADLVGAVHGGPARHGAGRGRRPGRAPDAPPHGSAR